jgi:hypothetical protein
MSSWRFTAALSLATLATTAGAFGAEPTSALGASGEPGAPIDDPAATPAGPGETVVFREPPGQSRAGESASAGAFLPFTLGASTGSTYGSAFTGYDGARRVVLYEAAADAHIVGGLSLRAGFSSHDLSGDASVLFGGRFQVMSQKHYGLDLTVGAFYLPHDIEGEGLIKASVLVGRNFGAVAFFGAMSYGQDPEGDDHRAELAMGTLLPVGEAIFVGLDARLRTLVFSSDKKHDGMFEPVIDLAVGPLVHYVLGPIVLTGHAGLSALAIDGPRGSAQPTRETRYGMLGLFSAGFAL